VWSTKKPPNRSLKAGHSHHEDAPGLVHRRYSDYRTAGLSAVVRPQNDNRIDLDVGEPVPLPRSRPIN
jgi:hypothetical protein